MPGRIELSAGGSVLFHISSEISEFSKNLLFILLPLMVVFFQSDLLKFIIIFTSVSFVRFLVSFAVRILKDCVMAKNNIILFLLLSTGALYWLTFLDKSTAFYSLLIAICVLSFSYTMIFESFKFARLSFLLMFHMRFLSSRKYWRIKNFFTPLLLALLLLIFSFQSPERTYSTVLLILAIFSSISSLLFLSIKFYRIKQPDLHTLQPPLTPLSSFLDRKPIYSFYNLTGTFLYNFALGGFTPLIIFYFKIFIQMSDLHFCLIFAFASLVSSYSFKLSYKILYSKLNKITGLVIICMVMFILSMSIIAIESIFLLSVLYVLWAYFHTIYYYIVFPIVLTFPVSPTAKKFYLGPYFTQFFVALGVLASGFIFMYFFTLAFAVVGFIYVLLGLIIVIAKQFTSLTNTQPKVIEERASGEW